MSREEANEPSAGQSRDQGAGRLDGAEKSMAAPQAALSDDYAATGMGRRTRHEVYRVALELDPEASASVRVRYEFRPQLVRMGILPEFPSPMDRRERARGFESYCPEP